MNDTPLENRKGFLIHRVLGTNIERTSYTNLEYDSYDSQYHVLLNEFTTNIMLKLSHATLELGHEYV